MTVSRPSTKPNFRDAARLVLRRWLLSDEGDVLASVDSLGAASIRMASEASARLDRGISSGQATENSLQKLQALAASLEAPKKRRTRSFFGWGAAPNENEHRNVEALIEGLDRERDNVAQSLITIATDRNKLNAAVAALEEALLLIRACATTVEAAGRELMREQPARARFLCDTVHARLLAREQDVATQIAVTQQGILTLQLLLDGQDALAQALARARDTSVSALRTAIAARRVIANSQDVARQTDALERTARAAEDAPAATQRNLRRILDDAADQARRAIQAAQATQRGTPL